MDRCVALACALCGISATMLSETAHLTAAATAPKTTADAAPASDVSIGQKYRYLPGQAAKPGDPADKPPPGPAAKGQDKGV